MVSNVPRRLLRHLNAGLENQSHQVLNGVIERRESIVGLLAGSMSRDAAYHFIKLGRNVERADMTTRIVDVNSAVVLPVDAALRVPAMERLWMSTLSAMSAYQMYRRHVGVHVSSHAVVDFLLKDPHFPRTVQFCIEEIETCLSALPEHAEAMRAVRRAARRLRDMRLDALPPVVLHEYLDQIQADLGAIHQALSRQYFSLHQNGAVEALAQQ